jgi:cell pole-organizing protein PopZ
MSAASPRTQEPSMEDILASIRRIIADDQETANAEPAAGDTHPHAAAQPAHDDDEVLDLAEIQRPTPLPRPALVPEPAVQAIEPVISRASAPPPPPAPEPKWEPEPEPEPEPEMAPVIAFRPTLQDFTPEPEPAPAAPEPVQAPPQSAAALAFAERDEGAETLETLVSNEAMASVGQAFGMLSHTILTQNARTLEDLVKDMLKPMLKAWLDDNLPPLVERLVRTEIERVARGGR